MRQIAFAIFLLVGLVGPMSALAEPVAVSVTPVALTATDVPVTFSLATFDAPQVSGAWAGTETVTVSVDGGTWTLATVAGLSFSEGDGVDDATVSFSGPLQAVNAALDGLMLTPPAGFSGTLKATLKVTGETPQEASWRVSVNASVDADSVRTKLLAGVTQIHSGVQPGRMVAYGPTAYDLAWYEGDFKEGPWATFATLGSGRVIAMPDHQMLNLQNYGDVTGAFFQNGVGWLAGEKAQPVIVTLSADLAAWLTGAGYTQVKKTNKAKLAQDLVGADVLVPPWLGSNVSDEVVATVGDFVRAGGGLFLADYGDGYDYWWGKPYYEAAGNRLLREAGIGFAGGIRWDDGPIDATGIATGQVTAEMLLAALLDTDALEPDVLERAGVLFGRIFDGLAPNDPLAQTLDARFWTLVETLSPTPETPISNAWEKGLLLRELTILESLPLDAVTKHRTADAVFGAVPDDAPRVTETVIVDPSVTRWHATGLYVPPGEIVDVTLPPNMLGKGLKIHVSGNRDNIKDKNKWLRMPRVARTFAVDQELTQVASPFGGALYVDTGKTPLADEPFEVTAQGAVKAPYFVLGTHTDEEWIATGRDLPGPYAELVANGVAISLPSKFIRELENPVALMTFWSDVITAQDTLGGHAHLRTNNERINVDVQISLGYLHSGYPCQGPHVAAPELVSLEKLTSSGSWGWFHEMGHEMQRKPDKTWPYNNVYTFDDSVECTVNFFTSYAYDTLKIPSRGGWTWTGSKAEVMRRALEGLSEGETYLDVGVGVKLAMFLEFRDAWGWETFTDVLTGFLTDEIEAPSLLPSSNQEKRDQWAIRYSNIIEHDVTGFMQDVWGIPLSPETVSAVSFYPPWLPAVGGIEGTVLTPRNTPVVLRLQDEALSHDGVAPVSGVTEPAHGTVMEDPPGVFTYTPHTGFVGTDSLSYDVTSSTGHVSTSEVTIEVVTSGVLMERWLGIEGSELSLLKADPRFPDAPDEVKLIGALKTEAGLGDAYGVRLRAYLSVPEDGDYTFVIASDDQGELWLSSDFKPDNASLIAHTPNWSGQEEWDKFPEQTSAPVSLKQGKRYYIEAMMKEGGGGDHLAVGWVTGDGTVAVIGQENLTIFRPDNQDPVAGPDTVSAVPGETVIIDVLANDTDADGDTLEVSAVSTSDLGVTPTIDAEGRVSYTLPADALTSDKFNYALDDGFGGQAMGEVTITLSAVNPGEDTAGGVDAGGEDTSLPADAGGSVPGETSDGCGTAPPAAPWMFLGVLMLVGFLRRRSIGYRRRV